MIVATYWLTHDDKIALHIDEYPRWVVAVDNVLERHPHWRWWTWLWSRLLPSYGDPLCYVYCARWAAIGTRSRFHVTHTVTLDQVPPTERGWIEHELAERKEEP